MKALPIVWQRLVDAHGTTCDRCSGTYDEVQRALRKLERALPPLGIEPVLEVREIAQEAFLANPAESNRIWIAGRPLEEWLGAQVGSSPCCSVCGDAQCRTMEVGASTFEVIPEALIVQAALAASSQLLGATQEGPVCCPPDQPCCKP